MEILNNIVFKTNSKHIFENLKNINVFDRNVDLLIFAMAIGIAKNKRCKNDGVDTVEINFSTLARDLQLRDALEFLYKTAILTTSTEFSEKQRLKLAFDPEYKLDDFTPIKFLIEFASYGMDVIRDEIYSPIPEETIEKMSLYFKNEMQNNKIDDDIINGIIAEELKRL